jgi:hypothetical protein
VVAHKLRIEDSLLLLRSLDRTVRILLVRRASGMTTT